MKLFSTVAGSQNTSYASYRSNHEKCLMYILSNHLKHQLRSFIPK